SRGRVGWGCTTPAGNPHPRPSPPGRGDRTSLRQVLQRPLAPHHSVARYPFPGQLAAPDRGVERAREVNPRQLAVGVVGGVAGGEPVVRCEGGAGALVEGAGGVAGVGHAAQLTATWLRNQSASSSSDSSPAARRSTVRIASMSSKVNSRPFNARKI